MKPLNSFFFALAIFFGCDGRHRVSIDNPYPDFDSAIEAIATTEDIYVAGAAAEQLYSGGVHAINALREHLSDDRVVPSGFCTRSLNNYDGLTMAEQMRWSIQDMIETSLPKVYDDSYYVLRSGNLEQWLDQRAGMSFIELQIEAATTQLNHAKGQMAHGDPYASGAIDIIEDRLLELRRTAQE